MKQEFFEVAMRKKIYNSVDGLQQDLDTWLHYYNHERPHSGKFCYGKTPIQTFIDSKKLALEKNNEIIRSVQKPNMGKKNQQKKDSVLNSGGIELM